MKRISRLIINKYGEVRSFWSITIMLLLIIVSMTLAQLLVREDNYNPLSQLLVTAVYAIMTIGGTVLLLRLIFGRKLSDIGVVKTKLFFDLCQGLLLGLILTTLFFLILLLVKDIEIISVNAAYLLTLDMLVEVISLAVFVFVEELLTRGYFMTALKTSRNKMVILLTSAIIFALLHLLNEGATVFSTFNTFLAGVVFAAMFIKSGKLWLSCGFHFAWNFLLGTVFGFIVSGNKQLSVLVIEGGNNVFLSGGIYGPEGSVLVSGILLLALLYVRFGIKGCFEKPWRPDGDLPLKKRKANE